MNSTISSYLLLLALLVFVPTAKVSAQMVDSTAYVSIVSKLEQNTSAHEGKVTIKQSSSISRMLEEYALQNQKNQSMQGWRIRICKSNNQTARQQSEQAKALFDERYPEVGSYLSYKQSNFTVVVGDFRTVDEAEKFFRQLKTDYPEYSSAWVVEDAINFPPL